MVNQQPSEDIPRGLDIDLRAFRKYKKSWLLWRACGTFDNNGSFVSPISFEEAKRVPKEELDIYFELDHLLAIRQKQVNKPK